MFSESPHLGTQTADAPDDQIDLHAGGAGRVQLLDQAPLHETVHLRDDLSRAPGPGMVGLAVDFGRMPGPCSCPSAWRPQDEGPLSLPSPLCDDHLETPCTSPLR